MRTIIETQCCNAHTNGAAYTVHWSLFQQEDLPDYAHHKHDFETYPKESQLGDRLAPVSGMYKGAVSLLDKMLQLNPEQRITVTQRFSSKSQLLLVLVYAYVSCPVVLRQRARRVSLLLQAVTAFVGEVAVGRFYVAVVDTYQMHDLVPDFSLLLCYVRYTLNLTSTGGKSTV